MGNKNLLDRVTLDLQLPCTVREEEALAKAEGYADTIFVPVIDEVVSRLSPSLEGEIDHIDIDLGTLHLSEVSRSLSSLLEEAIIKHLYNTSKQSDGARLDRLSNTRHQSDILNYNSISGAEPIWVDYLLSGVTSWKYEVTEDNLAQDLWNSIDPRVSDNKPQLEGLILRLTEDEIALYRFLNLLSSEELGILIDFFIIQSIPSTHQHGSSISLCQRTLSSLDKGILAPLLYSCIRGEKTLSSISRHVVRELMCFSPPYHSISGKRNEEPQPLTGNEHNRMSLRHAAEKGLHADMAPSHSPGQPTNHTGAEEVAPPFDDLQRGESVHSTGSQKDGRSLEHSRKPSQHAAEENLNTDISSFPQSQEQPSANHTGAEEVETSFADLQRGESVHSTESQEDRRSLEHNRKPSQHAAEENLNTDISSSPRSQEQSSANHVPKERVETSFDNLQPSGIDTNPYGTNVLDRNGSKKTSSSSLSPHPEELQQHYEQEVSLLRNRLINSPIHIDHRLSVDDAGLVLLYPFLPTLFERLGFLDQDQQFLNTHAQERAIHLLRYLVGIPKKHLDYLLTTEKILCGLPPQVPISSDFQISEMEKEETHNILSSVCQYWVPLRGTSREGLQQTFLQREGTVEHDENTWIIRISGITLDILLEDLPWPLSFILLPWMQEPVVVEWTYE